MAFNSLLLALSLALGTADTAENLRWEANGNRVVVQSPTFQAEAARISYDEATQVMKLEGSDDRPARIWMGPRSDGSREAVTARRIEYDRKTGVMKSDNTRNINVGK
jgi:lipopolysaccharide export system protein LptA